MVDKYIKFSQYILSRKNWEAENLINTLVKEIYTKYSKPVLFVSDHKLLFTFYFWSYLCYYLEVRFKYNTAFYLQIDNQIEY